MDVAAEMIRYLDAATPIEWYHDVPEGAPAEFGTLTRDGGPSEAVRDLPTLTLMVHAQSRGRSEQLAEAAKAAVLEATWNVENVFGAEVMGIGYDPLDGRHRHRITTSLIVND